MRLVCPNCEAQYEIQDGLIPPDGRDVQCSNCGHTWFEGAPEAVIPEAPAAPEAEDEWQDMPAAEAIPEPAPEPEARPAPSPRSKPLDPAVADILREEAAKERAARAAEQVQSQPDLGLGAPEPRRIDHTGGPSRRELLPDIEAINSSLAPAAGAAAAGAAAATTRRKGSGFWRGFFFVVTLAALAVLIYVLAPRIMEHTPDNIDVWLQAYVDWVDELRLKLDLGLQALIDKAQNAQRQ